jgi:rod shape-determining protein MreC
MLRRVYDILFLFKEYLLLAIFILISILLLSLNDTAQIRTIRSLTVAAVGVLQDVTGFIPNYFDLRNENRVLRGQNLALSEEVSRLREARLENARLRQMLDLKEQTHYSYVGANVVGKNLQLLRNTITIDAGERDGIKPDMPIVTEAGLVGKVIATSSGYAIGQIMLNKDFRASAKVQRARVDGIVAWEGGEYLLLKNVAKTLDVQVGDVVITSEYSSIFPSGIRIGIVAQTTSEPGALFQHIEIAPSVNFSRLEQVFVISHVPDSGRVALERRFLH